MNEFEIKEKSMAIYEISQEIHISNQSELNEVSEILKGVKQHRKKITEYWKTAKAAANKAYMEIRKKEQEMLKVCDQIERNLKSEILSYREIQRNRATKLSDEAEKYRRQEVDKLLIESIEAQERGDEETAKCKLRQAEMIKNLEKYTAQIFQKPQGISVKRLWQVRIVNNESVPAFFNGIEIREINTAKLLEIRSNDPSAKIPGAEFYQQENISVRSV